MRSLTARGLLATIVLTATSAHAHLGLPGGRTPFVKDGAFAGGGTTWGIVLQDVDAGWARVCEESVGSIVYFQERTAAGVVLVGAGDGLFTTTDGGCTYQPAAATLQGATVSQIAVATDRPLRLFVSFSPTAGATIARSDDGGLTFTALDLAIPSFNMQSLVVSDDGERVYATGAATDDGAPRAFASTDGGATFVERAFWPAGAKYAHVRAIDTDGEHVLATAFDDTPGSTLLRLDRDLGDAVSLQRFERVVTDVAAYGPHRFVMEVEQILWRQDVDAGTAFERVTDGPVNCVRRVAGDLRLWGCGGLAEGAHFFSTEDGVVWSPSLPFDVVAERTCPAGTPGEVLCRRPAPGADGGNDDVKDAGDAPDGGDDDVPDTCACAATEAAGAPLAAALLALVSLLRPRSSARGHRRSR